MFRFLQGPLDQPVYLDYLECRSTDTRLSDCRSSGLGISGCGHDRDIAVVCVPHTAPTPVTGEGGYYVHIKDVMSIAIS